MNLSPVSIMNFCFTLSMLCILLLNIEKVEALIKCLSVFIGSCQIDWFKYEEDNIYILIKKFEQPHTLFKSINDKYVVLRMINT